MMRFFRSLFGRARSEETSQADINEFIETFEGLVVAQPDVLRSYFNDPNPEDAEGEESEVLEEPHWMDRLVNEPEEPIFASEPHWMDAVVNGSRETDED